MPVIWWSKIYSVKVLRFKHLTDILLALWSFVHCILNSSNAFGHRFLIYITDVKDIRIFLHGKICCHLPSPSIGSHDPHPDAVIRTHNL